MIQPIRSIQLVAKEEIPEEVEPVEWVEKIESAPEALIDVSLIQGLRLIGEVFLVPVTEKLNIHHLDFLEHDHVVDWQDHGVKDQIVDQVHVLECLKN